MASALRVRLHRPAPAERSMVLPWLPEAVAAIQGRNISVEPVHTLAALHDLWEARFPAGETLLGTLKDGTPLGVVRLRAPAADRLVIDALAVRADHRDLGYGQELLIAAEESYGAAASLAAGGVPRSNGLAVYFWLRAGYRPCFPDPGRLSEALGGGRLWMVRSLSAVPA